jgi:hypothetical protein
MGTNGRWEMCEMAGTVNRLSFMYNQEYANCFPDVLPMETEMGLITGSVNYLVCRLSEILNHPWIYSMWISYRILSSILLQDFLKAQTFAIMQG